MDKDYYREYFGNERNHWWFRARSSIIKEYIVANISSGPLKILNVGVATGASTEMLMNFGAVTSIEYEQDCIDFIRDKVPFIVEHGSILELNYPDHSFDLVCAFDVIEHVEQDDVAVRELSRVCKPGGSVLVTVPAGMSLWSEHDEVNHHFRRYTRQTLVHRFRALPSGDISFVSYFNFFLFPAIYAARKFSNVMARTPGEKRRSDFARYKPGVAGAMLFSLMKSESFFLNRHIQLPFGVSLILQWKKHG